MDESMEDEDSLLSSSSFYPTARGGPPPILPTLAPGRHQDASFDYPTHPRRVVPLAGRMPGSGPDEDEDEDEEEEDPLDDEAERAEGEEEDEADEDGDGYAESDTSSAMFDPDADPEGFAKRLDELAGVKELGEEETRALKWGPPISRGADGKLAHSPLPLEAFRKVIDHYLTSTEWKYADQPGGAMHGREGLENGLTGMSFDSHPISVFGQNRGGETHVERALHESSVGSALGIEGLPMTTRLLRHDDIDDS